MNNSSTSIVQSSIKTKDLVSSWNWLHLFLSIRQRTLGFKFKTSQDQSDLFVTSLLYLDAANQINQYILLLVHFGCPSTPPLCMYFIKVDLGNERRSSCGCLWRDISQILLENFLKPDNKANTQQYLNTARQRLMRHLRPCLTQRVSQYFGHDLVSVQGVVDGDTGFNGTEQWWPGNVYQSPSMKPRAIMYSAWHVV